MQNYGVVLCFSDVVSEVEGFLGGEVEGFRRGGSGAARAQGRVAGLEVTIFCFFT